MEPPTNSDGYTVNNQIIQTFLNIYSINIKRSDLEDKLHKKELLELQVFATCIGIIPHNSKEKMVQKISFKLIQKLNKDIKNKK